MDSETQVYSDIYDIVKNNREVAGKEIPYTRDTFLFSVRRDRNIVNVFDLLPYDNESFVESLYVSFFYRTIDEGALENWKGCYDLPKEEFQSQAMEGLAGSVEFHNDGVILMNNVYASPSTDFSLVVSQSSMSSPYIEKLYHLYAKLPKFIQKLAKSIVVRFR